MDRRVSGVEQEPVRAAATVVRVLGALQVERAGSRVALGAGAPRTILALLASRPGRWVSAAELQEALGELDPSRAWSRSTIYSAVWRLRRVLGVSAIDSDEAAGYRLQLDECAVDGEQFLQLAMETRRLLTGGDDVGAVTVSDEATGLWRGEPFGEWSSPTWFGPIRDRLIAAHFSLREDRADALILGGKPAVAVDLLRSLVAEAPMREHAWALLVTALQHCGRPADACRAFDGARVALAEAGLEPGVELRAALDGAVGGGAPGVSPRSRAAGHAPDPSRARPDPASREAVAAVGPGAGPAPPEAFESTVPRPVAVLSGSPIVGRHDEIEWLLSRVRGVTTLGMGLTILEGEPGIGKTRLAAEVAARAHGGGLPVWFEIADHLRGSPSGALATWFRRLLAGLPEERLAELMRGPLAWLQGKVAVAEADNGMRFRFAEAIAELVNTTCATGGVLVIDEGHLLPDDAWNLLRRLLVTHPELPVHIVVLMSDRSAPAGAHEGLRGLPSVSTARLGPLDEAGLRELVAVIDASSPWLSQDPGVLAEACGGNPMLAQALVDDTRVGPVMTAGGVGGDVDVIVRRLVGDLDPVARWILELLAVAASVQPIVEARSIISAVGDFVSAADLMDGITSLKASGVLRDVTDRPGAWRFAHGAVATSTYSELWTSVRHEIHAGLASCLGAGRTRCSDDTYLVAEHVWRAWPFVHVDGGDALLRAAGECAREQGDHVVAATWFTRALEWSDGLADHGTSRQHVELLLLLGHTYADGGRTAEAEVVFAEAYEIATHIAWADGRAGAALGMAASASGEQPPPRVLRAVHDALAEPGHVDPFVHGQLLGYATGAKARRPPGLTERVSGLVDAAAGRLGMARLLALSWWTTALDERSQLVADLASAASDAGPDGAELVVVARILGLITEVGEGRARLDLSAPMAVEIDELVKTLPGGGARWLWAVWCATASTAAARFDEARAFLALAQSMPMEPADHANTLEPEATRAAAVHEALHETIAAASGMAPPDRARDGDPYHVGLDPRCASLYVRARSGARIRPEELDAVLADGVFDAPATAVQLLSAVFAAEAAVETGHAEAVAAAAAALAPHAHRQVIAVGVGYYHGAVAEALGVLRAAQGDSREGERLLRAALASYERIGVERLVPRVLQRLDALPGSGDVRDDEVRDDAGEPTEDRLLGAERRLQALRARIASASAQT